MVLRLGDNTSLHPHATVGSHAKVGNNCTLYPHATIYHDCLVGNHCTLHAGCVIGADGFGFAPSPEGYEKNSTNRHCIIEDNVEIGANTCVDRATMGATIVHKGGETGQPDPDSTQCGSRKPHCHGITGGYCRFYQSR